MLHRSGAIGQVQGEFLNHEHEELLNLYASGRIKPFITRKISFEDIPSALTDLANRKVIGRVVAMINPE